MKLKILCPEASCGKEICQIDIKDAISLEEFQKFESMLMDKFVHEAGDLQRCPTPDCKFMFDPAGQQ